MAPAAIMAGLHKKFTANISSLPAYVENALAEIDEILREIDKLRASQGGMQSTPFQTKVGELIDEIFSDLTIATYLSCVGLFVPARMSARRALEVAIALIVMWDNPVLYYGWKADTEDLTFKGMLAIVSSASYRIFIEGIRHPAPQELDTSKYQQLYRRLSNTVHGKSADIMPAGPQRYSCDEPTRHTEALLLKEAAQLTLTALAYRLPKVANPNVNE